MKSYQQMIAERLATVKKTILLLPICNGKKMSRHYFLNPDHSYRPCYLMTWARQFESEGRQVADNIINGHRISTVWLGTDHNYFGGLPLLFETMVFNKDGKDIYCARHTTWDEALGGHKKAMAWVINGFKEEEE